MAQDVEFVLSAKEAGAVRAWLAVQRAQDAAASSLGKIDDAQTKNAKSADASAAARKRGLELLRMIETEEQKYQRLIDETTDLVWKEGMATKDAWAVTKHLMALKHAASAEGKKEAADAAKAEADRVAALQRHQQLERQALQLTQSLATTGEKYRAEIERINELKRAGVLSEESYARAVRAAREEMLQASGHVSKREKAEQELSEELRKNALLEEERGAAAWRVLHSIQTPQQRYNLELRNLNELRKQNLLTEQQYAAAVRKTKADLDASKQSSEGWFQSVGAQVSAAAAGYLSVSAAIGGIKAALNAAMESQKKYIEDAERVGATYDKIFRQFRIQAGLGELGGKQAKTSILQEAEIAGFTEQRAGAAATALVSAGVKPELASGGALRGFLATLNAQGLRDSDPSQYADAMTGILQSNGIEVNEENMTRLGVQLQSQPIKDTKLKLTQLPQLSSVSAGLKGALTQQEQLATFAVGGSVMNNFDKMATDMADLIKNLQISGSKKDATEYLGKIGLKSKDVDFVGEDFKTVMTTLKNALAKAPEERRKEVLAKVIEGGNIPAFNIIQDNLDRIIQTSKEMEGADAQALYKNDVAVGSSGIDAATTRQALRHNRVMDERNTNGNLIEAELRQAALDRGDSALKQDLQSQIYNKTRYAGGFVGVADEGAAQASAALTNTETYTGVLGNAAGLVGTLGGGNYFGSAMSLFGAGRAAMSVTDAALSETESARNAATTRMGSSLEQMPGLLLKQNQLVEEQNVLLRGGAQKPNTTPAAPVPSASNDSRSGRP